MTPLVWDQPGERLYQSGVDRGVLYLAEDAVVWNGLTGVEDDPGSDLKEYHLDGVKYLQVLIPGDFSGKLTALMYPDEFDSVNGITSIAPGLSYHNQSPKSFSLSYRTRIGNDLEGTDYGYKLHILYNVMANPDALDFVTSGNDGFEPLAFSWTLTGTPVKTGVSRPPVHVSIDSRTTDPGILEFIERMLYGTDVSDARLPTIQELADLFGYFGALLIIDHGDGTWSAIDEADTYITMLDATTFEIDEADAVYLDVNTYEISSTNV